MTNELIITTATILGKLTAVLLLAIVIIQVLRRTEPRWRVLVARAVLVGLPLVLLAAALQPKFSLALLPAPAIPEVAIETSVAPAPAVTTPASAPATTLTNAPAAPALQIPPALWLLAPWALVALALTTRELLRFRRFNSHRHLDGTTLPDVTLTRDWLEVCTEFGVDAPKLRITSEKISPYLASGYFKALVIPDSLTAPDNRDTLRHVFRHEAAHLAHHDPIWIPLARFGTCFLWFHPLAWWLESLHLRACEEACDAEAARRGGSDEYSGALATLALELVPQQHPATAFLRLPSVRNRIHSIKHHARLHPPTLWKTLPLMGALTLIALAAGNLGIAQQSPQPKPATQSDSPAEIENHLQLIVIPSVSFKETPFVEAIAYLQETSAEQDAEGKGVQVSISKKAREQADMPITLRLTNVPLIEALRYTTELAGLKFTLIADQLVIVSRDESGASKEETAAQPQPPVDPAVQATEAKLKNIVIPSIEFKEVPFTDAVDFLRQQSVKLDVETDDPSKKGINVIIRGGELADTPITLKLTNVPLGEALRYLTQLSGTNYKVEPFAVVIGGHLTPTSSSTTEDTPELAPDALAQDTNLYTRTFTLPPGFLDLAENTKDALQEIGIAFAPGTSAIFNPSTNQLVVRNTNKQLEYIEALLDAASGTPGAGADVEEDDASVALMTKAYALPEEAFKSAQSRFGKSKAQEILDHLGVGFPPGTAAIYNPQREEIIIRNTTMQLKSVDTWIQALRDLN
ncbi:MAG: M56 family metallopeptidase [Verrucomicrobiota bacterium]